MFAYSVNMLDTAEFYTLSGCILLYVNYSLLKLFFRKVEAVGQGFSAVLGHELFWQPCVGSLLGVNFQCENEIFLNVKIK